MPTTASLSSLLNIYSHEGKKQMNSYKKKIIALEVVALALGSMTLSAAAYSQIATIEEVVVTAQKREQSLQDVSVAVTAFAGDDIQDLGMSTAVDLAGQTPGLTANNSVSGGSPIYSIRGVGLDDFNYNNAGAVGVYVDQVYQSSGAFLNSQLMDISRIEVLKGPQGTLYGRNTTGGAINIISAKPTEEFEGFARIRYGSYERAELEAAVSGGLGESVQGRLAVSWIDQGEGWQDDILTGQEYGKEDKQSARLLLAFQPGDRTDILLNLHGSRDKSISAVGYEVNVGGPFGELVTPGVGWKDPAASFVPERDEQGYGASLTIDHEADAFTFTSITAYDEYEVDTLDAYDGSPFFWADLDSGNTEQEQISQEIRFTSNSDGKFFWVAGASVSRETSKGSPEVLVGDVILDPRSVLSGGTGVGIQDSAVQTVYDQ